MPKSVFYFLALLFVCTSFRDTTPTKVFDPSTIILSPVAGDENSPLNFHYGSLESALQRAKEERKLIFLDFYADWCGPCKIIEEETFIDPEFYNYINDNYIPIKIHGDDVNGGGFDIAHQFQVVDYPTLMVLNHKGNEMGRVIGYNTTYTYLLELKRIERYSAYQR